MRRFAALILLISVVGGVGFHSLPLLHHHSLPEAAACTDSNLGERCYHLHFPAILVNIDLTPIAPEQFAVAVSVDKPYASLHPPLERPPRLIS
jgi:hypothetical protein